MRDTRQEEIDVTAHVNLAGEDLDHFRWVKNPAPLIEKMREWLTPLNPIRQCPMEESDSV